MSKVLCFGSLNIDHVYRVPHMVMEGETLSCTSLRTSAGGKGANQSAAMARAGLEVYHAGRIGPDGRFLVDLLDGYGVDTRYIDTTSSASGNAIIQVDDEGRNCIMIYPGGNREITKEMVDAVLSDFSQGDWLVLQNEINLVDYLITCASRCGMRICFNPAPYSDEVKSFHLDLVDIICVNEIEGAALAGLPLKTGYETILETLVEAHPHPQILLTAGSHGAYYGYRDRRGRGYIVDLPVRDTTAAGDTFIGYYIASIERGFDVDEALAYACRASSIAVSREGAMQSIPAAAEVFT